MKKMNNNDVHDFIAELIDKGKIKYMAFEKNKVRDHLEKHQEVFTLRPYSHVNEKFVETTSAGYFFATKVAQVMPKYTNYKDEWIQKSGFESKEEWDNELCEIYSYYREPLIDLYNLYHLISIDRYLEGDIPKAFIKKPFEKPKQKDKSVESN